MPSRLRPTAAVAPEAILVGDPGRALLLAQELLEAPKMSNHARGLWGYTGATPEGRPLTLQSTGMGGPSAAIVLADLAELGLRRAVRIGTCAAIGDAASVGELLLVAEAHAWEGSGSGGRRMMPDPGLTSALAAELGERARPAAVVSLDELHHPERELPVGDVADMQTATLLARAGELAVELAAILIVSEATGAEPLDDEKLATAATAAGRGARSALFNA